MVGRHPLLIKLRDGRALSTLIDREQIIGGYRQRGLFLISFNSIEAPARPPEALPRLSHDLHGSNPIER